MSPFIVFPLPFIVTLVIALFNFDRTISNILISNILNIERKFNTAFCYIIGQEMYENEIINCEILKNIHLIFDEKKYDKYLNKLNSQNRNR